MQFVRSLADRVAKGEMAARTARHVRGVVRTMFRDAKLEGLVSADPFAGLPRKLLPKPPRSNRSVYSREEVARLLGHKQIPESVRVLLAMMLFMGVRQGEACGRRWRDWDRKAQPLGGMSIETQYDGEPLKTDNARKVPVHPNLERILAYWWDEGFELTYQRKPTADEFIVPNRHPRIKGDGHTKSSAYKAMARACKTANVHFEGCHLTRHTMITSARRGGAPADVLERVTHNAAGTIIDQYTHWDWEPLCRAVACIDYGFRSGPANAPAEQAASGQAAASEGAVLVIEGPAEDAPKATPPTPKAPRVHVAFHVAQPRRGQKHELFGWRRRESNSSDKWRTERNRRESTRPEGTGRGTGFPRVLAGSCRA